VQGDLMNVSDKASRIPYHAIVLATVKARSGSQRIFGMCIVPTDLDRLCAQLPND